ncbi:MAG: creatininase family protein [Blautia faecis]
MYWDELTADHFAEAVQETKVCVIPMGVVEKHGSHLPLGTDMIIGRTIAEMAAKIEPFVIFPYYCFGQINEARHVPWCYCNFSENADGAFTGGCG